MAIFRFGPHIYYNNNSSSSSCKYLKKLFRALKKVDPYFNRISKTISSSIVWTWKCKNVILSSKNVLLLGTASSCSLSWFNQL